MPDAVLQFELRQSIDCLIDEGRTRERRVRGFNRIRDSLYFRLCETVFEELILRHYISMLRVNVDIQSTLS